MKALCAAVLLCILTACSREQAAPARATPAPATPAPAASAPATPAPAPAAAKQTEEPAGEATKAVWRGQIRIDAHAGTGTLDYVGEESGDFVPMHFRLDSEVGAKIVKECADQDMCEVEGSVVFLDEPPPENASAVGKIVAVDRVKKLPKE